MADLTVMLFDVDGFKVVNGASVICPGSCSTLYSNSDVEFVEEMLARLGGINSSWFCETNLEDTLKFARLFARVD